MNGFSTTDGAAPRSATPAQAGRVQIPVGALRELRPHSYNVPENKTMVKRSRKSEQQRASTFGWLGLHVVSDSEKNKASCEVVLFGQSRDIIGAINAHLFEGAQDTFLDLGFEADPAQGENWFVLWKDQDGQTKVEPLQTVKTPPSQHFQIRLLNPEQHGYFQEHGLQQSLPGAPHIPQPGSIHYLTQMEGTNDAYEFHRLESRDIEYILDTWRRNFAQEGLVHIADSSGDLIGGAVDLMFGPTVNLPVVRANWGWL